MIFQTLYAERYSTVDQGQHGVSIQFTEDGDVDFVEVGMIRGREHQNNAGYRDDRFGYTLRSVKNQIIQYSGGNIQQVTKKFLAMEHRHFEEVHRVACDAYNVPIQITY